MKLNQLRWNINGEWQTLLAQPLIPPPQLILVFGETSLIKDPKPIEKLLSLYPGAKVFGCSTAGEISGSQVLDDTLVATAIHFESSSIKISSEDIYHVGDSMYVGRSLASSLEKEGLVHAFVLSDGLTVNGSALVEGMLQELPANVTITGGLSGDKDRFQETLVFCNGKPEKNKVTILGLYGDKLKVGYGSFGGWDPFGPERLVTRSDGNVLYELDGKSCLGLYKTYLGDHAKGLPATALLFPLCIRSAQKNSKLVRTILSVNEDDQSMIFAGDIPEGSYAQFMKANFNRLIDGAIDAAKMSCSSMNNVPAQLAVLISCVGRKMVLKQRVEEEVEGVHDILGEQTLLSGFYSYGEMSPSSIGGTSELHNQTMTITTFTEN